MFSDSDEKKKNGNQRKMTKVNVSNFKDLERLRASKEVKLILVLPAENLVPLGKGKVVDLTGGPKVQR